MPRVICKECGYEISLSAYTYWNAEGVDVRCSKCGALLSLTLKNGELKRVETKERAKKGWQL